MLSDKSLKFTFIDSYFAAVWLETPYKIPMNVIHFGFKEN